MGGYQYGTPAYPQQPVPVVVQTNNGMAVASLVLGIVGAVFGLVPIAFVFAWICGVLAVIFGAIGRKRGKETGQRKTMATWGLVLGVVAIVLGVIGIAIVNDAFNDVNSCIDSLSDNDFGNDSCD